MIINDKIITSREKDFKFHSHNSRVKETGLEFQELGIHNEDIQDRGDNYNAPVEYCVDELSCIEVPIPKADVPKTYQRVIEVYEMNEAEINVANKIRYILGLIFKGFFKGENVQLWCAGVSYGFIAYDLIEHNYLAAIVMYVYSLLYTDVITGFKTLIDYFSGKKRTEIEAYLEKYKVLDYTNAMKSIDDVKMYVKFRRNK